ncbi:GumC family protein [Qipengyuania qiaonensis]|uniref:non-specific protein-tyrosine kinase n=1 Tax=Qipengyuania qiaonensis TaxID=2867240 RepID=A0ABS7J8L1_9SPHN|nr:polysaccharide biosynthesis tyrosine autokinase [Qipengyuania qiaonensis]MBX7483656.1 polysaccharide biosynthesis tyrosine autokinase [Qipengyuania qiaonensis]
MNTSRQLAPIDNGTIQPRTDAAMAPPLRLLPDPRMLWIVFRRNIKLFLALFGLVWLAFTAWAVLSDKIYTTRASILFEETPEPIDIDVDRQQAVEDRSLIDTEVRMMTSPDLVQRAAAAYAELYPRDAGDAWTEKELDGLGDAMVASLAVTQDGSTRIVDLTSQAEDPQFAADVANLFSREYIQTQIDLRSGSLEDSDRWLKERLQQLEQSARETQAAVDEFKVRNDLVSANGATVAEQEVSTLNQQLASAQADLAEKEGRLSAARDQLGRGGGGADVGAALGSGTITNLRQQEAQLGAELAEMRQRYGPDFPRRRQVEERLAEVQAAIQREINRIISSLSADVQTAQSRVNSLLGSRSQAEGELSANGRAQTVLNQLEQKARAARTVYQDFLERSSEASAARFLQQPDARIVREAEVPLLPSYPDYRLAALLTAVLSLGLGLVGVAAAEYLRRGVETKKDVEQGLRVHYAGAIPDLRSTTRKRVTESCVDYVIEHPRSLFAESFRNIRMFLTLSGTAGAQVLAITSALPQEGKTTTSACLARTTAASGLRTLLIDTDFRRRGSSEILGFQAPCGLSDVLFETVPLRDSIYVDPPSGLHVLGIVAEDTMGELASHDALQKLLEKARREYDVVVIDTGPILGVADARQICSLADRVLLLSRWRETSVKAVEAAIDILEDSGALLAGIALTQVDVSRFASTGESDVFAYTAQFRGYYVS